MYVANISETEPTFSFIWIIKLIEGTLGAISGCVRPLCGEDIFDNRNSTEEVKVKTWREREIDR